MVFTRDCAIKFGAIDDVIEPQWREEDATSASTASAPAVSGWDVVGGPYPLKFIDYMSFFHISSSQSHLGPQYNFDAADSYYATPGSGSDSSSSTAQ